MPYHHYFEHCRALIIFAALKAHQPIFLSQPEWKTIPFSARPEGKHSIELLFDIMSDCPQLWFWHDQIEASAAGEWTAATAPLRAHLLTEASALLGQAHQWRYAFDEGHLACRIEVAHSPLSGSSGPISDRLELSWNTIFQYSSMSIANTVCFYDGIHIQLLWFIINHTLAGSENLQPNETTMLVQLSEHMRTSAIDICKSVSFHLLEKNDSAGGLFLLFPLLMAWRAFDNLDMEQELRWVKTTIAGIGGGEKAQWAIASTL